MSTDGQTWFQSTIEWHVGSFISFSLCLSVSFFLGGGGMEVGVEVRLFNHSEITQLSTGNLEWMMW